MAPCPVPKATATKNEADNTLMIRQRVSTLITTVSLLLSLTAVSVVLPASTLAAIPEVAAGRGTVANDLGTAFSAEPKKVSPGAYVQFKTWARNEDTSTISQFFLTETNGLTIYSASWLKSDGTEGNCATTIPLSCSFGQLKPWESIDAVIVLQAPLDAVGSIAVEFVWSTVGIGHGDSFPVDDSVGIKGGGDFSGRFLVSNDSLVVGDTDTLSITNPQSTIVISPTRGIGVSVEDGAGTGDCIPAGECFGETSEIQVGDGSEYGQFKVVVNLHSSQNPKGVNVNNLKVYHDGEQITTICADVPVADCYSVKKFKWGLQVTIWLEHNGKLNMG
jgi:hypothetical protein